ncbi:MAG: hypothetical protein WEB87_07500, partial [Bacteriovoracaceae bacterium]
MKALLLLIVYTTLWLPTNPLKFSFEAIAQEKTEEELQDEVIDYSNIQKVLKKDGLKKQSVLKRKIVTEIKKEKAKIKVEKYNYPKEEDFWSFASQLWLVKNAQELKWDAPRPDYGIKEAFKSLLETFGFYHEKFQILVIDSPNIAHMALPSNEKENIFLLSLPFMRTLDLTKVDITLL